MAPQGGSKSRLRFAALSCAAVLVASFAVAVILKGSELVASQEGEPVANPHLQTPLPYVGQPSTIDAPDYENPPSCQLRSDERATPGLPPLSCRHSGAEPSLGAIPTAQATPDVAGLPVNEGWQIISNPLFRQIVGVPPGWYSNMRAEGGEFKLYDPIAVAQTESGNRPGGIIIQFSAREEVPITDSPFKPVVESHLSQPNALFGSTPGAIWDDGDGEDLVHQIRAAYAKDGIVFEIRANIGDGDRTEEEVSNDVALVYAILATVTPY